MECMASSSSSSSSSQSPSSSCPYHLSLSFSILPSHPPTLLTTANHFSLALFFLSLLSPFSLRKTIDPSLFCSLWCTAAAAAVPVRLNPTLNWWDLIAFFKALKRCSHFFFLSLATFKLLIFLLLCDVMFEAKRRRSPSSFFKGNGWPVTQKVIDSWQTWSGSSSHGGFTPQRPSPFCSPFRLCCALLTIFILLFGAFHFLFFFFFFCCVCSNGAPPPILQRRRRRENGARNNPSWRVSCQRPKWKKKGETDLLSISPSFCYVS